MFAKSTMPLAKQPAYQEAIAKVVEIGRALTATTAQLEKCKAVLFEEQNKVISPPSLVDRALALASGASLSSNPPASTTTSEIKRLEEEQKALQDGLHAASAAAEQVERTVSHEVGLKSKTAHVAAVKNILECLQALCAANEAEQQIRHELIQLGYHYHGIPHQGFQIIGQIDDRNGSPAYYWAREARQYVAA